MKDAKFIELLNLYVDQQIDATDAALLESEILHNPARRRTYQQYCRMHRACAVLFEQSLPQGGVSDKLAAAAQAAEEKVVAFPAPRRRLSHLFYAGGLAAAACVAVLFVNRQIEKTSVRPAVAESSQADQIVQIAATPQPAGASVPVAGSNYHPVLVTQSLRLNSNSQADMVSLNNGRPLLDWVDKVQLAPLQMPANDAFFANRAVDQNAFSNRRPMHGTLEKAAWQFQR